MTFVNWINKLIVARIRRDAQPVLVGDEIIVKGARFALKDATDIVAYERDIYAGSLICLLLSFADKKLINVNQEDACWNDLVTALDRLALTKPGSSEWIPQVISGVQKTPMPLRSRAGSEVKENI
jgi:hypothetical protein